MVAVVVVMLVAANPVAIAGVGVTVTAINVLIALSPHALLF